MAYKFYCFDSHVNIRLVEVTPQTLPDDERENEFCPISSCMCSMCANCCMCTSNIHELAGGLEFVKYMHKLVGATAQPYLRATMRKIDKGSDPNPGKCARGSLANCCISPS